MNEYDAIKRGKSPQTFRLTGRDGPPGSGLIFGVPAWLAEEDRSCLYVRQSRTGETKVGNPVSGAGDKPEVCRSRGKPHELENKHGIRSPNAGTMPPKQNVDVLIYESINTGLSRGHPPEAKFLLPAAGGKQQFANDRGHPAEIKYDIFYLGKLPGKGVFWKDGRYAGVIE